MEYFERYPREHFTKVLKKICQRLDKKSQAIFKKVERINHQVFECDYDYRVTRLWVVGSYARGAITCGDLDLVFELESKTDTGELMKVKRPAMFKTVKKTFFALPRYVSISCGNPLDKENSAGVVFSDVIEVWNNQKLDWERVIDAIPINPDAGRQRRLSDEVPFRMEQLDADCKMLEEIVEQRENKLIEWEYEPFLDVSEYSVEEEGDEYCLKQLLTSSYQRIGPKTKALLPHILYVVRKWNWKGGYWDTWRTSTQLMCSLENQLILVLTGRPNVYLGFLNYKNLTTLVVIPSLSRRGPNGAWIIKRGEKHPLYDEGQSLRK